MVTLIYELLYVITFAAGILSISSKFLGLGKAGFLLFIIELFLASISAPPATGFGPNGQTDTCTHRRKHR